MKRKPNQQTLSEKASGDCLNTGQTLEATGAIRPRPIASLPRLAAPFHGGAPAGRHYVG